MKRFRRILVIFVIVLLIAGGLIFAAHRYVISPRGAVQVGTRLQERLGEPVHVGGLDVGMSGSSLSGLEIFEPGAGHDEGPWLTVRQVQTDLSVFDLLHGRTMPRHLTLIDAAIHLRLDREGHLLTELPKSRAGGNLPDVRVEKGTLTIHQEGRPDFRLTGIDGSLTEDDRLVLAGTVADPTWGNWTVEGSSDRTTRTGSGTLRTDQAHVTQAMLDELPLVSPAVWAEVQAEGDTGAEVAVQFGPQAAGPSYRVALALQQAAVHVSAIDLDARRVRGPVVIENGVVELKDVAGESAGGELRTSGNLDFHEAPSRLQFTAGVSGLDVRRLPRTWSIPPQIQGRLTGHADLEITIADGKARTSGTGEGVITDARVAGQRAEPIRLQLRAAGNGYRFNNLPPVVAAGFQVTRSPTGALTPRAPVQTAIHAVAAQMPARAPEPPGKLAAPPAQPVYLDIGLAMKDVDLEPFVRGLGVRFPFPVSGRLSFQVHAELPIDTTRDLKTYRFQGSATLPRVTLAELEMNEVRARVNYAGGILILEELHGRVPPAARGTLASAGAFDGSARVQVAPPGDVTGKLSVTCIPWSQVITRVLGAVEQVRGDFSGAVTVRVPVDKFQDTAAWQASGDVTSERLEAYGLVLAGPRVVFNARAGVLTVSPFEGRLEGAALTGSAEVKLGKPLRYQGKVQLRDGNLAALQKLAPEFRLPVEVAGRLDVTTSLEGTLDPGQFRTSGMVAAADVRLNEVRVAKLGFRWEGDTERLALTDLTGDLYQGTITGKAVIPLRAAVPGTVELRLHEVDVGALEKDVPALPVRLQGRAGGTVEGTLAPAEPGRQRTFSGTLDLRSKLLRIQGIPTEDLHATAAYRRASTTYQVDGNSLGGTFHLDGEVPAAAAAPPPAPAADGHLRIERVQLRRLWPALGLDPVLAPLRGMLHLNVTYRLGPDRRPVGQGRLILRGLRWDESELYGGVVGEVRLTGRRLRIENISGTVAGGDLDGRASYSFEGREPARLDLNLNDAELAQLLAPWPSLAERTEGFAAVRLHGGLARATAWGHASIAVAQGRMAGVEVNDWHLPLAFHFAPGQGRGEVQFHDATALVGQGRVRGRGTWGWGAGARTEGQLQLLDLRLETLLRQLTNTGQGGTGFLGGRVEFSGTDVRSLEDLTATVDATFNQAQPQGIPVLSQIIPFLSTGSAGAGSITDGTLRARLDRGLIRIQRLTLSAPAYRLFIDGIVTPEERLDLNVTAQPPQLGERRTRHCGLGPRLPLGAPLALVSQAGAYLAGRLIHLRVTGTVHSPAIHIEPAPLLSEGAAQFFLAPITLPLRAISQ